MQGHGKNGAAVLTWKMNETDELSNPSAGNIAETAVRVVQVWE